MSREDLHQQAYSASMQEHVTSLLSASLEKQAKHHEAQLQRQSRPSTGFFLKINGTQLRSGVAPLRKRPRDYRIETQNTAVSVESTQSDSGEDDWPGVVLNALAQLVERLEDQVNGASSANAEVDALSSACCALRSLSGLEVRHCKLQARHIIVDKKEKSACLTELLLSPRRLWNRVPAMTSSPLFSCTALTTLDVECNALGDEGTRQLCTHLVAHLPRLERLLLASNGITAQGFLSLLDALTPPSSPSSQHALLPLETVGLTNNAVGGCDDEAFKKWKDVLEAFTRTFAATLRRLHLNHASLHTREAAELVGALFQHTCVDRDPCVFDLVYLRENRHVSKELVIEELRNAVADREALDAFVAHHVSW